MLLIVINEIIAGPVRRGVAIIETIASVFFDILFFFLF